MFTDFHYVLGCGGKMLGGEMWKTRELLLGEHTGRKQCYCGKEGGKKEEEAFYLL